MVTPDHQPLPLASPRDAPRRIALVAHDNKKRDLLDWARFNRDLLAHHLLFGTGTTGGMIQRMLALPVTQFRSGPLGGDQQLGAKIAEGEIDLMLFFWDPLEPPPTTPTSAPCCASRWSGTSRSPATGRRRTT
jgi:methylglyoxal synthase